MTKFCKGKVKGSPKGNECNLRVLLLYKYRQALCIEGHFFRLFLCKVIVRRTISSYNKELYFHLEKALWGFKCLTWTGWM